MIYLTSDTHFGHQLLIDKKERAKGFEQTILDGIANLPMDCTLIHLGDVCIGDDVKWNKELTEIPFIRKILVRGNHDQKSDTWYYKHGWDVVCDCYGLIKYGKSIMFSHEPMPCHTCDINIHGHWHNNDHRWAEDMKEWYDPKRYRNLAIEQYGLQPVALHKMIT